jgi:dienelactone hydrolase
MNIQSTFHRESITLANGVVGDLHEVVSANVVSYEDIIVRKSAPAVTLHAQLFTPAKGTKRYPVVVMFPGSGGVSPAMFVHAEKLTDAGFSAFVVDPFTGRNVQNTITEQQQFSFAASTWDVFAAMKVLTPLSNIDPGRIGAMGYSRGGTAVIQAAMANLATPALGCLPHLRAVVAGWPWCGYQFNNPNVGRTVLRMVAADHDNWCSGIQTQAYFNAIHARSPSASMRIVKDAHHGFGYGLPEKHWPEAMKALHAPVVHFNNDGVALDVWSGIPSPGLDDNAIISQLANHITRGVTVGSKEGQMADFMNDFTHFFQSNL